MKETFFKILIIVFVCVLGSSSYAQQMITVSQNASKTQNVSTLNGKAGVIFVANSDDMVITSSINKDPQSPKPVKKGGKYYYELIIDISASKARFFTITKYASTNSQKTGKIILSPDKMLYFDIEQVENGIDLKLDPNTDMGWINGRKGEALIEFNSKTKLTINCPNLKHVIRRGRSVAGTYLDSLIFDATQYVDLVQRENQLSDELETANKRMSQEAETMDDATYNMLRTRIPQLAQELNEVSGQLSELLKIEISGKETNLLTIDYNQVKNMKPMGLLKYNIVVLNEVVIKEQTFEEALESAKKRYKEYPQHTDFNFFDGAMTAYNSALNHKDCPDKMRPTLQAEYDSIVSIRKWVNFYERASKLVNEASKNSDNEYKYLGVELKSINHILKYHPEITGFEIIKQNVRNKIRQHPKSTQTVKRQRVSGYVSYADASGSVPFSSLEVFASPTEKIKRELCELIGSVNSDGTYSVLIPDKMNYIYVSGEKKAHYIGNGTEKLDIIIK
ncbi:MAG: hypothetical protein J5900_02740 [Prevotella sp.]|nr:hypothetical protein [Prevotella sp.]